MSTSQQIFAVFFAVLWGTAANAWPKWKPFHWTFFLHSRRVARRVLWSFFMLNIVPISYFVWIMVRGLNRCPDGSATDWRSVLPGVIPAFAMFGFYRLWIAGIELRPKLFYYSDYAEMRTEGKEDLIGVDPTIEEDPHATGPAPLRLKPKWWWANALFGIIYILFGISYRAAALLIPWLMQTRC
jgi:hypothetical protein